MREEQASAAIGDDAPLLAEVEQFITGRRRAPAPNPNRVLATVLYTDIVGSTTTAERLGDRAWLELRDCHDALVRRELRHHGGTEVNTTGDGFIATFANPSSAIRSARAIRDQVPDLGLEIRAGLHTGELERHRNEVAGPALHVGARVCALAGASEILASSIVRDLVLGSDFTCTHPGRQHLMGFQGDWTVLSLGSAARTRRRGEGTHPFPAERRRASSDRHTSSSKAVRRRGCSPRPKRRRARRVRSRRALNPAGGTVPWARRAPRCGVRLGTAPADPWWLW